MFFLVLILTGRYQRATEICMTAKCTTSKPTMTIDNNVNENDTTRSKRFRVQCYCPEPFVFVVLISFSGVIFFDQHLVVYTQTVFVTLLLFPLPTRLQIASISR